MALTDRDVSIPIDRQAVTSTKLASAAIAINVEVSCPIDREVSIAIGDNVAPCAKLLIARQVSLSKRAHPGVLVDHRV
jgi:hypothetical protein